MAKVIVGMSGGVDSAVAAFLLKQQGYEVVGMNLRVLAQDNGGADALSGGGPDEVSDVCSRLGIEYHSIDISAHFREKVVEPFIKSYLEGFTPNPCIECNRFVKWDKLVELADRYGAEYVATGHYAHIDRLDNGRYAVRKASQISKDQTYMLYKLTQMQLSRTLMPLGSLNKTEVRKIAADCGLPCAQKEESQEICFVTDGRYSDFISGNTGKPLPPEGNFVDKEGNILGRHKGIHQYTVGQRKGLGIALGYPAFVTKICPEDNTVVLGTEEDLMCGSFLCRDVNFQSISEPSVGEKIRCFAKARYHQTERPAIIEVRESGLVSVTLDEAVKGVSPGQSAVFYDEDGHVVGGGLIARA